VDYRTEKSTTKRPLGLRRRDDRCPRCGGKLRAEVLHEGPDGCVRIWCPKCWWGKELLYYGGKLVEVV